MKLNSKFVSTASFLLLACIVLIYSCTKKEPLPVNMKPLVSASELATNKDFQYLVSNSKSVSTELGKIYTSVLSQKLSQNSKSSKQSFTVSGEESKRLNDFLERNTVIKTYYSHLVELEKAYPGISNLSREDYRKIFNPAAKIYLQMPAVKGTSFKTSNAQTDFCDLQCEVPWQPAYDENNYFYFQNFYACNNDYVCQDAAWADWWAQVQYLDGLVASCKLSCYNRYPGVNYNSTTGMLEFSDSTAYRTILDNLTALYQAHQANFFDPLDSYTDDQVETIINSTGFDEFAPLRAFENYFGFNSLRQKVETEELAWLDQTNPFTSDNPDDLYYIDDEVERTLFNTSSQVKIGNLLIDYSSFPMLEETNETCVGNGWATDPPYNVSEFSIFEEQAGTNWRVWEKLMVRQGTTFGSGRSYYITPAYLKAKVKAYKITGSGGWKKKATKLDAKINGNIYRPNPWTNVVPSTWTQYAVVQSYEGLHRRFHQERSKRVNDIIGVKYCDLQADFLIDGGALTSSIDLVPNHRNPH